MEGLRAIAADRLRAAGTLLCVVGAAIAGYLTIVRWSGEAPACGITHGCLTVQNSKYSELGGVPVALLGLAGYLAIGVVLQLRGEAALLLAASMAVIGLVFSLYLTYRELFDIRAICQWCVASQIVMAALTIVVVARLLRAEPDAP